MKGSYSMGRVAVEHDVKRTDSRGVPSANVDPKRSKDNWVLHPNIDTRKKLDNAFNDLFRDSIMQKNIKNLAKSRYDRIIDPDKYHDYLMSKKAGGTKDQPATDPIREYVVQVGDMNDHPDPAVAKEMYIDYLDEWQKKYPNFKVLQAAIHLDEATPHMHIIWVPVKFDEEKVMTPSLAGACEAAGFGRHVSKAKITAAVKKGINALYPIQRGIQQWQWDLYQLGLKKGLKDIEPNAPVVNKGKTLTTGSHKENGNYQKEKLKELEKRSKRLDKWEAEVSGKEKAVAEREAAVTGLEAAIRTTAESLAEKETAIQARGGRIDEKEKEVKDKERFLKTKEISLKDKETGLNIKDKSVAEREETITEKETAIRAKAERLSKKETEINDRETSLKDKEKALEKRAKGLDSWEYAVADAQDAVKEDVRVLTTVASAVLPYAQTPVIPLSRLDGFYAKWRNARIDAVLADLDRCVVYPPDEISNIAGDLQVAPDCDAALSPVLRAMREAAREVEEQEQELEEEYTNSYSR